MCAGFASLGYPRIPALLGIRLSRGSFRSVTVFPRYVRTARILSMEDSSRPDTVVYVTYVRPYVRPRRPYCIYTVGEPCKNETRGTYRTVSCRIVLYCAVDIKLSGTAASTFYKVSRSVRTNIPFLLLLLLLSLNLLPRFVPRDEGLASYRLVGPQGEIYCA